MSTSSTPGAPEFSNGSWGPNPAQMPPGQMQPGQMPPGQAPQYQMPPVQTQPGQMQPGQMAPGQGPQYQMQPGQMAPGQMPQQQVPMGQLVVNVRPAFGLPFTWTRKVCIVDGYEAPTRQGANAMYVAAGQHHIELYSRYMRKYGHASIDVHVPPNGVTQVFYTEPATQFHGKGNVGVVPQPTRGKSSILLLLGLAVAVPFALALIVALISSLS